MIILVKDVVNMTIEGIKPKRVIITKICREIPNSEPASFAVTSVNIGASAAQPSPGASKRNVAHMGGKIFFAQKITVLNHLYCISLILSRLRA